MPGKLTSWANATLVGSKIDGLLTPGEDGKIIITVKFIEKLANKDKVEHLQPYKQDQDRKRSGLCCSSSLEVSMHARARLHAKKGSAIPHQLADEPLGHCKHKTNMANH